jgi:hypothetical protein
MTDKPDGKRWGSPNPLAIAILMATIYVASLGPACQICCGDDISMGALSTIYRPIFEVSRIRFAGEAIAFYMNLCGSRWKALWGGPDRGVCIRRR